MKTLMAELRKKVKVGLVGGSDFVKLQEQMGGDDGRGINHQIFDHLPYKTVVK